MCPIQRIELEDVDLGELAACFHATWFVLAIGVMTRVIYSGANVVKARRA